MNPYIEAIRAKMIKLVIIFILKAFDSQDI